MKRYLLAGLFTILAAPCATAATFCVTDANGLQNALSTAANNGQDDVIKMEVGTYVPPTTAGFSFASGEAHSLSIAGGYITFLNTPCGLYFNSASTTVIDGGDSRRLLDLILVSGAGNVSLSRLTFARGTNVATDGPVGIGSGDYGATITLDRVMVADNHSAVAALVAGTAGGVIVKNSVFTGNTITAGYNVQSVIQFESYNPNGSAGGMVYTGNTAAGNRTDVAGGGAPVSLFVQDAALNLENSVFWDNTATDLSVEADGSAVATVSFADIGVLHTFGAVTTSVLVNVDPLFVGNGDYRLRGDSPLRDFGDNFAPGGIGSYDAAGQTRVVNGNVDMGAYEVQDLIFKDGFD